MALAKIITCSVIECGECGVVFALSDEFMDQRKQDHRTWYCPNGHQRHYPGESREEKLKRQLDRTSRQLSSTQSALVVTKRQKAAAKGQLTKTRRRVANGVCPCCNRTFADLAAHMHGQHPEYAETSS
jgi:hypothetical protein